MAEGTEIHPGSFVGDSIEEWKKLPTWGKIAVGVALAVVAYLAIRARSQTAQQAASSTAASPDASGTTAGTQSPFPMVNGLPLLPSNVNPVYDSTGNPVAFQQSPLQGPTNPTSPTQTGVPPTQTKPPVATPLPPKPALPVSPVVNTKQPLSTFAGSHGNTMNGGGSTAPHITSAVPQARPTPKPPAPPPAAPKPPWWSILGGTQGVASPTYPNANQVVLPTTAPVNISGSARPLKGPF